MPCPESIVRLIERFDHQLDQVKNPDYNETQLRIDFVNPMFRELGWDIDNRSGYAEQYREVVHEDRVRVAGANKAPDYSFRVGGNRKFFLEAKKPFVNLKENWEPAYQLRRYAWSAKLAASLLTDFEELAVYDCRIQPKQFDKASVARREYITYQQYPEKWDFLVGTFSKEAVLRGDFDRYCGTTRGRGAQEFDDAFLEEIEEWRKKLASNIALRNEALDERSLNFAVQRIIDRIIFLRICEDRGIEHVGQLRALLNAEEVYPRLSKLFRDADDRYNSGLFYFRAEKGRDEPPDELTPGLDIDDATLKQIIRRLYYPESPYEFTVVSADILGSVYERFLGKVITLTGGHRAKIEEKPEVRKAGGVYYTPTYIVDYIVQHTVGKLLEDKTPKEAARLKILDPACGSGSFLIGAYQYLLDWHLKWYIENQPEKWCQGKNATLRPAATNDASTVAAGSPQPRSGQGYRLAIKERKRILLDNIHGVDIDYQAVEVTKLSLLLKVLEGETAESVGGLLRLFHERALPDLGHNIQCGNSLIGTDIMTSDAWQQMNEDERRRVNPFDFERAFPPVFKQGGFDAVIGNPPYVRQESIKSSKNYFQSRYKSFNSTADLYVYFIERGTKLVCPGGTLSYIVSSSFLRSNYGEGLREYLSQGLALQQLVDFGGLAVFEAAKDTYVCIPLIVREEGAMEVHISRVKSLDPPNVSLLAQPGWYSVPRTRMSGPNWSLDPPEVSRVFETIRTGAARLGDVVSNRIFLGIKTGLNEAFELNDQQRRDMVATDKGSERLIRRFLGGQNIRRYHVEGEPRFLIAVPSGFTRREMAPRTDGGRLDERAAWRWFQRQFPGAATHLAPFAEAARKRTDQGEFWWELRPCDYYGVMDGPKILYPDIAKSPRFYLDNGGTWIRNTGYCLDTKDRYLLALLNSRVTWFCVARISIPFGERAGEYRYRMFTQYVAELPVVQIPFTDHRRAMIGELGQSMSKFQSEHLATKLPQERERLQRQLDAIDRQIDELVYRIYGLADDEVRTIENTLSTSGAI